MQIEINTDNTPSKSKFDELFEVHVIDFGDSYHKFDDDPKSEFEESVRGLVHQYRDVIEYSRACSIYDEYMDMLARKYGSRNLVKQMVKQGTIEDYVPHKPRLKNTKRLKALYKEGIVIGKPSKRSIIVEDVLEDTLQMYYEDYPCDDVEVYIEDKNKVVDKIIEQDLYSGFNFKRKSSFSSDIDFLDEFFKLKNKPTKKKGKKTKKKDKKNRDRYTDYRISDLMSSNYLEGFDDSNDPMVEYSGLLLSSANAKDLSTYHKLDDMGWRSYTLMKHANFSSRVASQFKKKNKKKAKKRKQYDDQLVAIMGDNGYDDFDEFSRDMLNMTAPAIFG